MADIRCDQFLVLLFMIETQHQAGRKLREQSIVAVVEQVQHMPRNLLAIPHDASECRPRHQTSTRPRVLRSDHVVIRVEQVAKILIETFKAGCEYGQDERFEKPAAVCKVPFDRAGFRHGLQLLILWAES